MFRPVPSPGCAPAPVRPAWPLAVLAHVFLFSVVASAVHAQPNREGKWTAPDDWSGGNTNKYAIHLLLLPEAGNPDSSRILWFAGKSFCCPFYGGEWRWGPGNDDCSAPPRAGWTQLPDPTPPNTMDLFCTSHAPLGSGGRVVFAGGTSHVTGGYGEKRSQLYQAGAGTDPGTWGPEPGLLADWRWYPTATTLRDGRVLVTGGSRHPHHRVFGGKRGAVTPPPSPSWGDYLYRFAPVEGGFWDASVLPAPDPASGEPPDPRYAHSGVEMAKVADFQTQVYFGGIGSNGQPRNDVWFLTRQDNPLGPDYTYHWTRPNVSGTPPAERSDHTAVAALGSQMVVFGGRDGSGAVQPHVWRLYKSSQNPLQYAWVAMQVSGATTPGARYGHGAVYDETVIAGGGETRKRMIVFGGASAPGQAPSDDTVWELRWDPAQPNQATWFEMTLVDPEKPKPAPRYWHSFTQDPSIYKYPPGAELQTDAHIAWLYGGALGGDAYSDELWALWILNDGTVDWQRWTLGPSTHSPGPRARHSVTLDPSQGGGPRLYLLGGENAGGPADPYVYKLDPRASCWGHTCPPGQSTCPDPNPACGPPWSRWHDYEASLSGHTSLLEMSIRQDRPLEVAPSLARVAETLDPVSLTYQKHGSANLYSLYTYPMNFVVPGGLGSGCRVLSVGKGTEGTYYLDIPDQGSASGWVPRSSQTTGFAAEGAVMYRPGRIMVAGGGAGQTKSVNATIDTFWTPSPPMLPRDDHNLVLLPDGKTIAIGGCYTSGQTTVPEKRPQIWDPDASEGVGAWTPGSGAGALAEQAKQRCYHSTAILLQDARVLSAGNESDWTLPVPQDKHFAEIYCPPYLFKNDGSSAHALRPQITGAPTSLNYRKVFTVCTPEPAAITRACLIRPGAATHGFDQNQRYVPLTFTVAPSGSGGPRLFVTAPASPDSAPPGDYMLFLTGAFDGATHYRDLPSIAKWVRLQGATGADLCDAVAPGMIDLVPDIVGPTEVYFAWTAPGDDGQIGASGAASSYDLRQSLAPITTEATWNGASPATGPDPLPVPAVPPTPQTFQVTGLNQCTTYHFALRATDDNAQLSPLQSPPVSVTTTCGGGPGGGTSAQRARDEEGWLAPVAAGVPTSGTSGSRERAVEHGADRLALAAGSSPPTSSTSLVTETERLGDGTWRISLRVATPTEEPGLAGAAITVEGRSAEGERDTLGRFAPAETENLLGLCALREQGRVTIGGFLALERLVTRFHRQGQDYVLVHAQHSRLGTLGPAVVDTGSSPELLAGDAIDLTYAAASEAGPGVAPWYVLVRRVGTTPPMPFAQRRERGAALPSRFVLYQNEPNPTGSTTLIHFDLPVASQVTLEVFDLLGRRVATLAEGQFPAGRHARAWDLRDAGGTPVRPGVYAYRLRAGEFQAMRKLNVLP